MQLFCGDCLDILPTLEAGSVDAVVTDPPYGTTQCRWDSVIPLGPMWERIERATQERAPIVLFGSQPFTSTLVLSRPSWFRYSLVWSKIRVTGHLNANRMPLRCHEDVLVFYRKLPTYNPQMTPSNGHFRGPFGKQGKPTTVYGAFSDEDRTHGADEYYPRSIVEFLSPMRSVHPTEKPLSLMEYLVKTYTNEGDVVLDFAMGSGTTGDACVRTGRNFIGIEIDPGYFEIAKMRIEKVQAEMAQQELAL